MARRTSRASPSPARFPHPRGDGPDSLRPDSHRHSISPPAWGWPDDHFHQRTAVDDFPTRVGMARIAVCNNVPNSRFPHPRGDGPQRNTGHRLLGLISPPAWGWPVLVRFLRQGRGDFPTRVGMARRRWSVSSPCQRFPHPRGDGPLGCPVVTASQLISPPAWGWPGTARRSNRPQRDFPTRVGMARLIVPTTPSFQRFPHPRGDGPSGLCGGRGFRKISPPAWGWPDVLDPVACPVRDFPTRVGMARHDG